MLAVADKRREYERGLLCDLVARVEQASLNRAIHWPALSATLSTLYASPALALREATFRIYSEATQLLELEPMPSVVAGLTAGLKDESPGVRIAALKAAVNLIKNNATSGEDISPFAPLAGPMLDILPPLAAQQSESRLTTALLTLIDLASTSKVPSRLLKPHLGSILSFSLSIISPSPFKVSPHYATQPFDDTVREPAIEFLISIAETAPSLTKSFPSFATKLVPGLLHVMGEIEENNEWYNAKSFSDDDEDDQIHVIAEAALDRLAQALGDVVFAPFVQVATTLLGSDQWQHRCAALSAFASIAEGCVDKMLNQMTYVVNILLKSIKDPHPRVQYCAIYAFGQLSIDLAGSLQSSPQGPLILSALLQVTNSPHPRLQAYACAALVNFFQDAEVETLGSEILQEVFEGLMRVLREKETFVKEHAMEAMTLLARSMEKEFTPFYAEVMPQLLILLETEVDPSLQSLRAKTLDCASTIGNVVDPSVFSPDAPRLLLALHNIRLTLDPEDSTTSRGLLSAFALLAVTVGPELFGPYLNDVLPQLLEAASKKTEISVTSATGMDETGADEEEEDDGEWDTMDVNGDVVAIKSSELEERRDAVDGLRMLIQAIGVSLSVEALKSVLDVAIPLLTFYFHVGVRESAAALVQVTVAALAKAALSKEQQVLLLTGVSAAFTTCIAADRDADLLSTFITSWASCYLSLPGCLAPTERDQLLKAFEAQLMTVAQRAKERAVEGGEETDDDLVEYADMVESDAELFRSFSMALRALLSSDKAAFPIGPFLPFLSLVNGPADAPTQFALRLLCDIVQQMENEAMGHVQGHLPRVLDLIVCENLITRKIAAFTVGVAAETSPATYSEFVAAAIEPLFNAIGPQDMANPILLAARDNAVSALGKIIRHLGDKLDADRLLPRWVVSLPIFQDADEMDPVYSLLLDLISRGHPSVAPTSDVAPHVLKVLVAALESEDLPTHLGRPVAEALNAYLAAVPGGENFEIPAHVRVKAEAILS